MRTLAIALIVLLALTPAVAAPTGRIVPGERIGPLRLGMSITDAVKALGEPTERREGDQVWVGWPREGLGVWLKSGRIVTIMLRGNRAYRTAEGVGIGTDREQVLAVYGGAYQAEEDAYSLVITYRRGITFGFDKRTGSAVAAIMVFKPR
jgi:hypothetical protein